MNTERFPPSLPLPGRPNTKPTPLALESLSKSLLCMRGAVTGDFGLPISKHGRIRALATKARSALSGYRRYLYSAAMRHANFTANSPRSKSSRPIQKATDAPSMAMNFRISILSAISQFLQSLQSTGSSGHPQESQLGTDGGQSPMMPSPVVTLLPTNARSH